MQIWPVAKKKLLSENNIYMESVSMITINNLSINLNLNHMGSILYIIAVILVIAWLVGFLGFQATGIIHALLVLAVIAVLLNLISGRRSL